MIGTRECNHGDAQHHSCMTVGTHQVFKKTDLLIHQRVITIASFSQNEAVFHLLPMF